jgi:hypothetical protein
MMRFMVFGLCLLCLTACRLPPDRVPLKPLPEDGQVYAYEEIVSRARALATTALEAFYVDNWTDLEDAARGLEQSARFLPKTSHQPVKQKDKLVAEAAKLRKEAVSLRTAAQAKNAVSANQVLQRINLQIRMLRPEPEPTPLPEKTKTKT